MADIQDVLYSKYKNVRDLAWQILIDCGINSLPVSVSAIAKKYHIEIFSYSNTVCADIVKMCGLQTVFDENLAFSVFTDCYRIFYNDNIPVDEIRFYLAHELCHILLRHPMNSVKVGYFTAYYTKWNKNISSKSVAEKDANRFAVRLLAPACVLAASHIDTREKIVSICGLPKAEAGIRAERIKKLNERNAFLQSNLEKQVLIQFQPFIDSVR